MSRQSRPVIASCSCPCGKPALLDACLWFIGNCAVFRQEDRAWKFRRYIFQPGAIEFGDHSIVSAAETRLQVSLIETNVNCPAIFMGLPAERVKRSAAPGGDARSLVRF
jgi:hypothetical protein